MRRATIRRAIKRCGIPIVHEDAEGIVILRFGGSQERWRIRASSGIGQRGTVSLVAVNVPTETRSIGPFSTQRELERALRMWRDWWPTDALGESGDSDA